MSERFMDVHTEHCCIIHGCKYGDENCTVTTGKALQSLPCEDCSWSGLTPEDHLKRDEWLRRMKDHRFKHMIWVGKETSIADVERWLRAALGEGRDGPVGRILK